MQGKEALQNIRYDIRAITMLHENHRAVRPVWTRFVEFHVSNAFYHVRPPSSLLFPLIRTHRDGELFGPNHCFTDRDWWCRDDCLPRLI